jgi:anti-sigma factor RsiW
VSSGRWRISVTTPDWGHDHLSSDAIVAYVDDELASGPYLRATQHLAQCRECAAQVIAQGQARAALRMADCPSLPTSLLSSLRSIPQEADLPAPPAGLAVTPDGQLVSVLRPERAAEQADSVAPVHGGRHRRLRLGTGVAMSGLAIGAIAFGIPGAAGGAPGAAPAPDDVLDRPAVGGAVSQVDARLELAPDPQTELSTPAATVSTSATPAASTAPPTATAPAAELPGEPDPGAIPGRP